MLNDELRKQLIESALEVRTNAYAPYSHYAVGAALLASSGQIYLGVNVENAAYPTGICAERVAVFNAITQGERNFTAIAIASANGGTPCGACRQVLAEFGLDTLVMVINSQGQLTQEAPLEYFLPGAFTPSDLSTDSQ